MGRPQVKYDISDINKALAINGEPTIAIKKFVELVQIVQDLGDKEVAIRARGLTELHIGMLVLRKDGVELGFLDDIDEASRPAQMVRGRNLATAYNRIHQDQMGEDFDDEAILPLPGPVGPAGRFGPTMTVVINGKIKRMHPNQLLILRETRDL